MTEPRTRRVLVVSDHTSMSEELIAEISRRATSEDVQFRLVVLNPARAEVHLLHPERHDKATEAERALLAMLPDLERAAGAHVIGSVSVRHDPMDAIEETVFAEPVDESCWPCRKDTWPSGSALLTAQTSGSRCTPRFRVGCLSPVTRSSAPRQ